MVSYDKIYYYVVVTHTSNMQMKGELSSRFLHIERTRVLLADRINRP